MEFEVQDFEVTAATHPAGYTNKVLLGSRQGPLQLWNIMHDKLIYTFAGWGEQVTVLEQVCLGGALSLWWTAQVTVLEQVYGDRWCIVTVVGCAGHRTGTGVLGWYVVTGMGCAGHCTGTGVCGWCIVTVVGRTGHCTGTGVWGSLVHCCCGGMRMSPYWDRCVEVAVALSLW